MVQICFNLPETALPFKTASSVPLNFLKCSIFAKYFAPTISFSENELNHIVYTATGKKDISSVWELNLHEMHEFNRIIREYGRKVMDNYALNFNRQDKGMNSGADLVYFAKIEHFRKFKGTDEAVLKGKAPHDTRFLQLFE